MNNHRRNSELARIIEGGLWLIKLRWFAVVGIVLATWIADRYLKVSIQQNQLYLLGLVLLLLNLISFYATKFVSSKIISNKIDVGVRIIYFQIFADLVLLTCLLHFSGGVENPFIIYYIFHMVLASILLSPKGSYIVTTFALGLIGALTLLEYFEIIPHYNLTGFNSHSYYQNTTFIIGVGLIFITTSYMVVYMTISVSSKLKQREEAYRMANIELKKMDTIKNEYVLRLTHDIKGHLATIQNCLDVVLLSKRDEDKQEFVQRAHRRTKSLLEFSKGLLKLTSMRLHNKVEMKEFSFRELINNIMHDFKTISANKNISISIKTDLILDKIYGNQLSIEEALNNVVSNAIKYSPKGSKIEINLKNVKNCVQIDIIDNGIGIPENEQKLIFDEFYRASNAVQIEKDSAGFGLSMVKYIIEKHQGKISIDSKLNLGTKVSILLPLCIENIEN